MRLRTLAGVIALVAAGSGVVRAQQVQSGLAFLKLGAGADAIGTADATVADPPAAEAIFYNPAALGTADRASVMIMHNESIQDVRNDVLGANLPLGDWSLGIGLQATTVAGIEVRDVASVQPLGTFTSIEGAASVGTSYRVSPDLAVGATMKFLLEKIYTNDAVGGAVDVGARYHREQSSWTFGAALQNLGAMGKLENESVTLPMMARVGASYRNGFGSAQEFVYTMDAAADKTFADQGAHVRFGGQLAYDNTVSVRAGFKSGYDAGAFTAGLGFQWRALHFDYALQPYTQSYGIGHAFSVNVGL